MEDYMTTYATSDTYIQINYYSNYANWRKDITANKEIILDSNQNILLASAKYYRNTAYNAGLRDYSGYHPNNSLLLRRDGYKPTQYWNTEPDGSGFGMRENPDGLYINGSGIAYAFGQNIDANSVEINVYAQWEKQKDVYLCLNEGMVYASDYIIDNSTYIDNEGKVHAPQFKNDFQIFIGKDYICAPSFRCGCPEFSNAAKIWKEDTSFLPVGFYGVNNNLLKSWGELIDEGLITVENEVITDSVNMNREGVLIIPNSVTSIEYSAFEGCVNLISITIPNSVTSIREYAFFESGLISITIPESVTSIGRNAFCGCTNLRSVTIPDGLTSIGDSTFEWCSSLASVTIPASVTYIGRLAFKDCSKLTSITIPASVTSIGSEAFRDCSKLKSIIISNGVTSIDSYAFDGCSSLASITIPASVTSIGVEAFPVPKGGYWYNSQTGARFTVDTIPTGVAATYVADLSMVTGTKLCDENGNILVDEDGNVLIS